MPKMKTHSGAKKRLKVTSSGKVLHRRQGRNHFLEKKSKSRKRHFTKEHVMNKTNANNMKKLMRMK